MFSHPRVYGFQYSMEWCQQYVHWYPVISNLLIELRNHPQTTGCPPFRSQNYRINSVNFKFRRLRSNQFYVIVIFLTYVTSVGVSVKESDGFRFPDYTNTGGYQRDNDLRTDGVKTRCHYQGMEGGEGTRLRGRW